MTIARMLAAAEILEREDPELGEWLSAGLRRWLAGAEGVTLEQALGLAGERHPHNLAVRDHHLRRAYALVEGASARQRLLALGRRVEMFRCGRWGSHSLRSEPDPTWSRLDRAIFRALQAADVATSISQLRRCVIGRPTDDTRSVAG